MRTVLSHKLVVPCHGSPGKLVRTPQEPEEAAPPWGGSPPAHQRAGRAQDKGGVRAISRGFWGTPSEDAREGNSLTWRKTLPVLGGFRLPPTPGPTGRKPGPQGQALTHPVSDPPQPGCHLLPQGAITDVLLGLSQCGEHSPAWGVTVPGVSRRRGTERSGESVGLPNTLGSKHGCGRGPAGG